MRQILFILLLIVNTLTLNSQTLLIQGKVINVETGEPVSTTIVFLNDDNHMLRAKSNSADGSYQQAIIYGKSYKILLSGYIPTTDNEILDLTNYSKYEELYFDIKVKPLKKNFELLNIKIFEPNDSVIINDEFIAYLKNFLLLNKSTNIRFKLSSKDSWFKRKKVRITVTNSKGKKYKKRVTLKTKTQLSQLLDARIRALKELLKSNRLYFKDSSFEKELIVLSPKKKRKKRLKPGSKRRYEYYTPEIPNLKIVVD